MASNISPTTTHFHFALQEPCGRAERLIQYPNCIMRHDPGYPIVLPTDVVTIESTIWDRSHSSVYRAKYPVREGGVDFVADVVIKFAPLDDIGHEASAYDALEELQGKDVPKFYGMFFGWDQEKNEATGCLVLEYSGNQMSRYLHALSVDEQAKILEKLARVHREGVAPLDLAERNILQIGNDYRIIDFHDAELNHRCRWKFNFTEQANPSTLETWQQCEILNDNARDMGYWENVKRRIRGVSYLHCSVHGLPPQEIINMIPAFPPEDMEFRFGQDLLIEFYRRVQEMRKTTSLEDIKRQQPLLEKQLWGELNNYPKCSEPEREKAREKYAVARQYASLLEKENKNNHFAIFA